MPKSFFLRDAHVAGEGAHVAFLIVKEGCETQGYISREALSAIDGGQTDDLLAVFHKHIVQITEKARVHWAKNPRRIALVLGCSEF